MSNLVIRGGRILDVVGGKYIECGAVLIREGRIDWVGPEKDLPPATETETIDVTGKTVTPGLIDAHAHLTGTGTESVRILAGEDPAVLAFKATKSAYATLMSGVTTVRDMAGFHYVDIALKNAIREGTVIGPRMLVAGKLISQTGGHCYFMGVEADGPEGVRVAARAQLKAGADIVKMMATGGGATPGQNVQAQQLTIEEMAAGAEVARREFKKSAAHAHGTNGIKNTVLAGVTSVEHCSFLTEEVADLMVKRGTWMVTTLEDPEIEMPPGDFGDRMKIVREKAVKSVALARSKGIKLAAGSDSGGNPYGRHGKFFVQLEGLVQCGLSPLEAIRSATTAAAELMGLSDEIGAIAPGKSADLLVIDGDPLKDVRSFRRLNIVVAAGRVFRLA
jgi:imidazolonepropionase-like amidohydrolase